MRPTADPNRLRQHAGECRQLASRLDSNADTLNSNKRAVLGVGWTGAAAESLAQVLDQELSHTHEAADFLRMAAAKFDQGASEVEAFIASESRREREEAERRRRANGGR